MTPQQETTHEILKSTYEELVETSGVAEAYLAGQLLGLALNENLTIQGYLVTIKMLSDVISQLSVAAKIEEIKRKLGDV